MAEFYEQIIKRTDISTGILEQGLEYGGVDDLEYLKATLRLLLRHQLDTDVQKIADNYLPENPEINDKIEFWPLVPHKQTFCVETTIELMIISPFMN